MVGPGNLEHRHDIGGKGLPAAQAALLTLPEAYQLVELMHIVGGIMLIWFGLSLGPVSISNGLKLPAALKSAQIDLPSKPRFH